MGFETKFRRGGMMRIKVQVRIQNQSRDRFGIGNDDEEGETWWATKEDFLAIGEADMPGLRRGERFGPASCLQLVNDLVSVVVRGV